MPYGNIALHGATLLHAAVEFGEVECIDTLVRFGADLNARAHEIGGIGGQTPVFHAVRAHADAQLPVLRHLNRNFGSRVDVTVRATFTLYGRAVQSPATPAELAVLPVEDLSPSPASAAELKKFEPAEATRGSSADAFIRSAVIPIDADHRSGNLDVASALLARQPSLPDDDFYAACVLGDLRAVTRHLERDPSLATSTGGPLGWPAICYVTFSRFLRDRRDDRQVEFAQVVRRLLDHGADARSFWMSSGQWGCEETALYGAAGIANSDAVTRVLLDAGATPDEPDTETLYHLAEHTDLRCLRLVLSRAKRGPHFNYAMCHQMDHEDTEGLRVFIEMGGDVNCLIDRGQPKGWRPLQFAIDRGRSTRVITMLLDAGADPTLTTDAGHTAMQFARMRGRADVTALLASRGVVEPLSERDRWLDAVNRADRAEIARLRPKPLQLNPHEIAMLPHAASSGRIDTVRAMLDEGWPIDARGMWGGPALHLALVGGQVEVARLLIERGADLLIRNDYGGDALGCLLFAYRNRRPEVEPLIEMITSRIPRSRVVELIDWHETDAEGDRGIARRLERAIQADTGS
jgi:ankyrin repeat protein